MSHSGQALLDPHTIFEKLALKPGMRVADLGCGRTGHFVFPAAKLVGDTGIVYAVEIVKNILESINSRIKSEGFTNVQTVWSDIEAFGKTPIPAESIQVCFLTNVLFMVKDKLATIQEAARLLQKEGSLVITDWATNLGLLGPTREMMLDQETVKKLAADSGLIYVDSLPVGDYHFCLVFKKV